MARSQHVSAIRRALRANPVVALLGPRQIGKTTLARAVAAGIGGSVTFFDLEDPADVGRLEEARLVLSRLRGLVVLDEVQRRPDLFPILRVLVDRPGRVARFLVLGSASPHLLRQASETLAGRITFHELAGLRLDEVGDVERLWSRGGFPRAYLARSADESDRWRRDLLRTYLERDLPQLGVTVPAATFRRFLSMLAHYHGQIWNGAELARALAVSEPTVRRYVDTLASTFVVRVLPPFFENLAKRQIKSPKVYLADSGLLHTLLDIRTQSDLERHPKLGASFEGFVIEQIVGALDAHREQCFFWGTHAGAEIDLVVVRGRQRLGFEIKRTDAPRVTPSIRTAIADLGLARVDLVHAGSDTYPLAERVRALAVRDLFRALPGRARAPTKPGS
ncbi:MAG: ATP-binding protein [Deltaproteobacteria bacterium]|nr:ATP-binding protein [Deltaproteobacteria bacterium]